LALLEQNSNGLARFMYIRCDLCIITINTKERGGIWGTIDNKGVTNPPKNEKAYDRI